MLGVAGRRKRSLSRLRGRLSTAWQFALLTAPPLRMTVLNGERTIMQVFHIGYRNTQGTLMRILNAVSRRGLDLSSVQAQAAERDHSVSLVLEVNPKQMGQLYREWYSIVDVTDVRSGAALREQGDGGSWTGPHPPASEGANG